MLTTADINGGTADAVVIGGASAAAGTFTTANATTVDTTNIEVTTLKAKDGSSAGSIANTTGIVTLASSVLTTTDINGGTADGVVIGGASAAAATFTNLTASGTITFTGATVANGGAVTTVDINGGTIDGAIIGGASAAAITGTTVDGTTITASTGFVGDGGSITGMSATQLTSGTVPAARLTEATAAQIRDGTASVLVTPANMEAASEEVTLTDAATIAVDWSTFLTGKVTLAGNRTLGAPTNAEPGTWRTIRVVQDGTGSRTLGFSAVYLTQDNETITLSTGAADKDTLYIYCETTSLFHVTAAYNWS